MDSHATPASGNFAFIGQFAESKELDCIFTTEYSVPTSIEAVYTLRNVKRGVPEVFNSTYDIRLLLSAIGRLRDGKEIDLPGPAFLQTLLMDKLDNTQIGVLLREFGLVAGDRPDLSAWHYCPIPRSVDTTRPRLQLPGPRSVAMSKQIYSDKFKRAAVEQVVVQRHSIVSVAQRLKEHLTALDANRSRSHS